MWRIIRQLWIPSDLFKGLKSVSGARLVTPLLVLIIFITPCKTSAGGRSIVVNRAGHLSSYSPLEGDTSDRLLYIGSLHTSKKWAVVLSEFHWNFGVVFWFGFSPVESDEVSRTTGSTRFTGTLR